MSRWKECKPCWRHSTLPESGCNGEREGQNESSWPPLLPQSRTGESGLKENSVCVNVLSLLLCSRSPDCLSLAGPLLKSPSDLLANDSLVRVSRIGSLRMWHLSEVLISQVVEATQLLSLVLNPRFFLPFLPSPHRRDKPPARWRHPIETGCPGRPQHTLIYIYIKNYTTFFLTMAGSNKPPW